MNKRKKPYDNQAIKKMMMAKEESINIELKDPEEMVMYYLTSRSACGIVDYTDAFYYQAEDNFFVPLTPDSMDEFMDAWEKSGENMYEFIYIPTYDDGETIFVNAWEGFYSNSFHDFIMDVCYLSAPDYDAALSVRIEEENIWNALVEQGYTEEVLEYFEQYIADPGFFEMMFDVFSGVEEDGEGSQEE